MKRILIGISGASGIIYGIRMLEALKGKAETHLMITSNARRVIALETSYKLEEIMSFASFVHKNNDQAASISSGSFKTDGMIIIPCSIRSLSGVANSYSDTLLIRAADVTLKEKRRLVLAVREAPFHIGHLKLMKTAAKMGAIIYPLTPAFYHNPKSINDLIDQSIGKILDLFEIEHSLFGRWGEHE